MLAKAGGSWSSCAGARHDLDSSSDLAVSSLFSGSWTISPASASCQSLTNKSGAKAPPANPNQTVHFIGRREDDPPDASIPTSLEQIALAVNAEVSEHLQQWEGK